MERDSFYYLPPFAIAVSGRTNVVVVGTNVVVVGTNVVVVGTAITISSIVCWVSLSLSLRFSLEHRYQVPVVISPSASPPLSIVSSRVAIVLLSIVSSRVAIVSLSIVSSRVAIVASIGT